MAKGTGRAMIPNCLRNESGMHGTWLPDMEGAMTLLWELWGGMKFWTWLSVRTAVERNSPKLSLKHRQGSNSEHALRFSGEGGWGVTRILSVK